VTAPRPTLPRILVTGTLLVLAGLASWALYAVAARTEPHAYARGEAPPATARLVQGHTYWISIPGGVRSEARLGLDPSALQCTAAAAGRSPGALKVTPQAADTKATDQIASFVAGFSGSARIECSGIGAVYVDNAADAAFDWSGFWLVLASALLVVGLPLTLAGLRSLGRGSGGDPGSDVGRVDPAAEGPLEFERHREADVVVPGRGDDLDAQGQTGAPQP
jgi:hypothetical protein